MKRLVRFTAAVVVAVHTIGAQTGEWLGFVKQARRSEAAGNYRQACGMWREAERTSTTEDVSWATANALARAESKAGDFLAAERDYRRVLRQVKAARGGQSAEYALLLSNLATLHLETGRTAAAKKELAQAVVIAEAVLPASDVRLQALRSARAATLVAAGKYDEAGAVLASVVSAYERSAGPHDERTGTALCNLAALRVLQGRSADAEPLLLRSREILEGCYGAEHPAVLRSTMGLAIVYAALGRRVDADEQFRRAVSIAEKTLTSDHFMAGQIYKKYSEFLRQCGRRSESDQMAERATQVLAASRRHNRTDLVVDASELLR